MVETDERSRWRTTLAKKPSEKSWWTTFLLSLFLGLYGADRIYLGSVGLGIVKLLTMGGIGIWWIADVAFIVSNKMRDAEGSVVRRPFLNREREICPNSESKH